MSSDWTGNEVVFPLFEQKPQPLTAREVHRVHLKQIQEATRLIADACYLLTMQDDGTLTEAEVTEWRDRWLQAAGVYLESSVGKR